MFDVVCTIQKKQDADLSDDAPSEVIRYLELKKQALESQKRVLEQEAELLISYARTLNGEHVDPTTMGDFLRTYVSSRKESLDAIATIDAKILEITRNIEKEFAKAAMKTGHTDGQVTIVLVAAEDSTAKIKLTYSKINFHH